jgi:hypothetical protein
MKVRTLAAILLVLGTAAAAQAAPNVTNVTQKGSLLVWPFVNVVEIPQVVTTDTLVRLQNDGSLDVDVKCYWMDGNKNRVDFIIPLTRNQAVWFDARTGRGTFQVNRFPTGPANGFDNPFLLPVTVPGPGPVTATGDGLLACWAVDQGGQNQVKWNHLSGTATIYDTSGLAFEYNAYAFFVPTGLDLEPVGVAGTLNLNGVEYDSCPLYQIGQFSPAGFDPQRPAPIVDFIHFVVAGCTLDLRQDWTPVFTKLQFDLWNEDEVKFTGAYECADSWHRTTFSDKGITTVLVGGALTASPNGIDAAVQNFQGAILGTYGVRYRVQAVKSTQCEKPVTTGTGDTYRPAITTQAVGVLAVQGLQQGLQAFGTTLASAGKFTGKISWDPAGALPEGGIR